MAIEGLHHVTAITGDAQANVDFYVGRLGLRLVKKTVNFDAPDVYHLYFGDEVGRPGSILTFFEFPGARPGRAGAGQVYAIGWRVASEEALDFWEDRLDGAQRVGRSLSFRDPEGLQHDLLVVDVPDAPLVAPSADVPAAFALQGFQGVRAYAPNGGESATPLMEALGFERAPSGAWLARGAERGGDIHFDPPPETPAVEGAGSVHHIAWSLADDAELDAYRGRAAAAGARATPIIDRQYFHSVYFRIPVGVLFELASRDIGFTADEPAETLGEALKLPPQHEPLRPRLEQALTPLHVPRAGSPAA